MTHRQGVGRRTAKRLFDLALAVPAAVAFAPLATVIAMLVRTDGGPALFRQTRVGEGGRSFVLLKFRSMRMDSERLGPGITAAGDARITRIGRLLRKFKLDELPQLWNVIRGEMSLVGPRPEVPRYVELYTPAQRKVLMLKPGITDEASLEFRDEETLLAAADDAERYYIEHCIPRKIEINLAYARHANVLRDARVIWRTVAAVWLRR